MVSMNLKSNKIGKERIDMLRENEVIVGLIVVDVVQAFIKSDAYLIKSDV